jgi:hypothetical protein
MILENFDYVSKSSNIFFLMAIFIGILISFSLLMFSNNIDVVFATTFDEKDNKNTNDNKDKFHLTVI